MSDKGKSRARRNRARRLLMQALYQVQLNQQPLAALGRQMRDDGLLEDVDSEFFEQVLAEAERSREDFDALTERFADRPLDQIDPVERAVLQSALAEFRCRPDVPFRVVISEAVTLAKRFGGTEGHRYVNAILDRAAVELRPVEAAR